MLAAIILVRGAILEVGCALSIQVEKWNIRYLVAVFHSVSALPGSEFFPQHAKKRLQNNLFTDVYV
jgi:hypothetical protein